MDEDLKALRMQLAHTARVHNCEGWRETSLVYADALEEEGQAEKAAHRRRKGLTRRSPGCRWPRAGLLEGPSPHQKERLALALCRPIGILTGSPGTGKTFITAAVVKYLVQRFSRNLVAACAPTGKAAVRLRELLVGYQVRLETKTIHSLLEIGRNGHDGEGWGFQRNEERPLEQRFIIVDEAGMLDVDLFAALLRACGTGTHLLLVGDPNQLPPVGHGAPLRDMITGGVPHGQLTEIRRNSGLIVQACAAIRDQRPIELGTVYDSVNGLNLKHIEVATPKEQLEALETILGKFRQSGKFDPVWDCQVLCAVNKGLLGRKDVNARLQAALNPDAPAVSPNPFREGDKVVCLRNHWAFTHDQGGITGNEAYVANGEQGRVQSAEPNLAVASLAHPSRRIRIPIGRQKATEETPEAEGEADDWDLAYAITCHKSQGSEWPCVIILLDDSRGACQITSREWIYTAISRASKLCITIGRAGVLRQMVKRQDTEKRQTFLAQLLRSTTL